MEKRRLIKVIAIVCAVVLILSLLPLALTFATDVSDESSLVTALQKGEAINLKNDITISSASWVSYDYNAVFNGNGHVIIGLTAPLFNHLGAAGIVQNLGVVSKNTVSHQALLAVSSEGIISSCFSYGTISYSDTGIVGGLVGQQTAGTIQDSFSCVNITAANATYVGGLIGQINVTSLSEPCVKGCYSAGTITANNENTYTAGLANLINGNTTDTYTSCQLLYEGVRVKPSGVNGLYDNQLGLVRESVDNPGLTTRDLMEESSLSNAYFAVTSTTYPVLKSFYKATWSQTAIDVLRVSTAAVAFSDIPSESTRYEPKETDANNKPLFTARTDYLTAVSYADKTNAVDLVWNLNDMNCKIYDSVPLTSKTTSSNITGSASDLLRSKFVFSADVTDAPLTVSAADFTRTWYLTSRASSNPYYKDGGANGDTETKPFLINNVSTLDHVRYYSLIGPACYKMTADVSLPSTYVPISDFNGVFDGNAKILSDLSLTNDSSEVNFGLFSTTQNNALIKNTYLKNVSITIDVASAESEKAVVGALIGHAGDGTTINNVVLYGTEESGSNRYTIQSDYIAGGLVGKGKNLTVTSALVSVELGSLQYGGGIVGHLEGTSTIDQCGVTGYIAYGSKLGGIIGYADGTSSVNNCYSTAAIITDVQGAVFAGGLLGDASATSIANSYVAGIVDAPFADSNGGVHSIRGNGNGMISNVCFDIAYALNPDEILAYKKTTDQLMDIAPSAVWSVVANSYPQLTCFTSGIPSTLSALSTRPIYVQQHFPDTETEDLTTGWIGKWNFVTPTPITALSDKAATVYEVSAGYGFEPLSGQRRMLLRAVDSGKNGVRVIGFVREDLISLRYTVTGQDGARAYVRMSYLPLGSDVWSEYEVMSPSAGTSEVLYDIPKHSQVKVIVETEDAYKVSSVTFTSGDSSSCLDTATDGIFTTGASYDVAVDVAVFLDANESPWGLRRESY